MHFLLVAEPQDEFQKWEQAQLVAAPAPSSDNAQKGLALFEQMSCVNCHAIKGTIASAQVGPDLTHFASRRQLGAGIADNTPEKFAPLVARSATGQGRGEDAELQIYGRTSHAAR
jgi:Cytochrome c.